MGRQLAEGVGTVWVRSEDGLSDETSGLNMVPFAEGDDIPKWAAEQMGDHCFASADDSKSYSSMSKAELEQEIADRGLDASGTKAELIEVLETNDESA